MKKLIAISVVFALVAGAAFAVDLGGSVIGTVNVVKGVSGVDTIEAGAKLDQLRIHGGGEVADGKFGGYFRFDGAHWSGDLQAYGNAYWKPIDQFKLLIGSNGGDGFYGKEGNTGWMFYQTNTDHGVAMGGDNVWGGSLYGIGAKMRDAFYGGDGGGDALRLDITPMDMLAINIMFPFFKGGEFVDVLVETQFQVDLHFGFGNIALTYVGGDDKDNYQPSLYFYYGGSFGDLSLDFGVGYHLPGIGANKPLGIGLGVKYASGAFGVKFRTVATFAGDDKAFKFLADVLPYYSLSDNLAVFVSVGLGLNAPDVGDAVVGWHFNPYLQIGEEWGAKFLVGIKLQSAGDDNKSVSWAIPIALSVGF